MSKQSEHYLVCWNKSDRRVAKEVCLFRVSEGVTYYLYKDDFQGPCVWGQMSGIGLYEQDSVHDTMGAAILRIADYYTEKRRPDRASQWLRLI